MRRGNKFHFMTNGIKSSPDYLVIEDTDHVVFFKPAVGDILKLEAYDRDLLAQKIANKEIEIVE